MDINESFGNFLKAEHLKGQEVSVTIASVEMEEIAGEKKPKPVIYFRGKERGLVLNVTNKNIIVDTGYGYGYGSETTKWIGKNLVLYSTYVDFQGKQVLAIRLRPPTHQTAPANHQAPPSSPAPPAEQLPDMTGDPATGDGGGGVPFSDDIPFSPEWRI